MDVRVLRLRIWHTHTFRLGSDDGSRLQIRDSTSTSTAPTTVVLMDTDQAYTTSTGTISLTRGRLYEAQVFWFEDLGGQRCTLEWQRPSDSSFHYFSAQAPNPEYARLTRIVANVFAAM
jgi:hypothetical protein